MKAFSRILSLTAVAVLAACGLTTAPSSSPGGQGPPSADRTASHIGPIFSDLEQDALLAKIADLDEQYFDAYNTCDLRTLGDLHAPDIEAYHELRAGRADWDTLRKEMEADDD